MDKRMKRFIKSNLKRKCYICKTKKNLTLHHKIPIGLGGDILNLDNIVFLCKSCHIKLHYPVVIRMKINPTANWFIKRLENMKDEFEKHNVDNPST